MTAPAVTPPPLTAADFLVLEEDERYHCEAQEGAAIVTDEFPARIDLEALG